jgi:hypothetical protein
MTMDHEMCYRTNSRTMLVYTWRRSLCWMKYIKNELVHECDWCVHENHTVWDNPSARWKDCKSTNIIKYALRAMLNPYFSRYEAYPQNKFRLQILLLQGCGHDDAQACRVSWSFGKARTPFADDRTAFTHRSVCLQGLRKSRSPPHVKSGL